MEIGIGNGNTSTLATLENPVGTVPAESFVPMADKVALELPSMVGRSAPRPPQVIAPATVDVPASTPDTRQPTIDNPITLSDTRQPTIDIPITLPTTHNPPTYEAVEQPARDGVPSPSAAGDGAPTQPNSQVLATGSYAQNLTTPVSIPSLDKSQTITAVPIQTPSEGAVPMPEAVTGSAPTEVVRGSVPVEVNGTVPTTTEETVKEFVPIEARGTIPTSDEVVLEVVNGTVPMADNVAFESSSMVGRSVPRPPQVIAPAAVDVPASTLDTRQPTIDIPIPPPVTQNIPTYTQNPSTYTSIPPLDKSQAITAVPVQTPVEGPVPRQPQSIALPVEDESIEEQPIVMATEKPVADIPTPTVIDLPNGKLQAAIATPHQEPALSLQDASGLMPLELPETNFAKSAANQGERNQTPFRNPSDDSVRRFQRAMDASASVQLPTEQIPIPNPGLGAMPEASVGDASARTAEIAETVSRIIEAVSEQIEVRPAMVRGEEEVVIRLKPTVLGGSEIKLSAKDGILSLEITPATPAAEQLVARNVPQLERALAEHVPAFRGFTVTVRRGRDDESK